jgi:hypothetical protein
MYSAGGYNFSNYGRTGKEPNKTIGKQHVGNLSLKYLYQDEEDSIDDEDLDYDELPSKANSKIVHSLPMGSSDPYAHKVADRGAGQLKNLGGAGGGFLQEFAGDHKTTARKGISPFKQPKHSGPPLGTGGSNQAFRTTGNKIDLGSRKGFSKPHDILNDDDGKRYFSLMSLIDDTNTDDRQTEKQQNRVKKILNSV